jgi:YebC/PmpR family DNA-binding regulatory protein
VSGHSKWHNIRLRKAKVDAVRGRMFTKVAREIIMAAREGGGNPDTNARLRLAVQKARDVSMPHDNIKRAIQRGTGELEGASYEQASYEGYGPGGVAVMIQVMTDNRNRTVGEIRNIFTRNGGNLGESGCVAWMFSERGVIVVDRSAADEETILGIAIEAGADDVRTSDKSYEILSAPGKLEAVRAALEEREIPIESAEISMIPNNTVSVERGDASKVLRLMDALEDHDDVQQVYANFDIPDEVLEEAA